MPTGSQLVLNRRTLPEGEPDLVMRPCAAARDLLIFTASAHGQSFYSFANARNVAMYQLEPDYFYPGHTFSGVGRYLLLRVVNAQPGARLELWLTASLRNAAGHTVPPAAAVGTRRVLFPIEGRGSARVFSPSLPLARIDGQDFVLLDLGRNGTLSDPKRTWIERLFGRGKGFLDPRFLTSYVRDVSLVSGAEYSHLVAPSALANFPADLADKALEYSGIYEDGWVGARSYAVLRGGPASTLSFRANVLPRPHGQRLTILVDGRVVLARPVQPGAIDIRVRVPASSLRRKIELRFAGEVPLEAPDTRHAAAHISFLGLS
jgi:hypothetical protein